MGHFNVFPNLYVVLVGPAGNRKTSAMTPAKNLMRTLEIPFSAECVTKEKLVLDIKSAETIIGDMPEQFAAFRIYAPMTCMVTELSEFLGAGGVGMINFLTTIYDQDFYDIRTKNKGDTSIIGPYLTLLACTTPDWITTYLRQDVISGGFSRRAIFVLETGKSGRIPFPEVTPEMAQAWENLVSYSKMLAKVRGPFTWDPEAKEFFSQWYIELKMPTDPTIIGYYETKHMQLLKVAMLISISESPNLILTKTHLQMGLDLLGLVEANLGRVFAGIGRNELNAVASKVLSQLESGPVTEFKLLSGEKIQCRAYPERKLLGLCFHAANAQELSQVFQHLIDTGKAVRETVAMPGLVTITYIRLP